MADHDKEESSDQVPPVYEELARSVVFSFYTFECFVLLDLIIRHPFINETTLLEHSMFEKQQMSSQLAQLRNDWFVKRRMLGQTDADGRMNRQFYYYVSYRTLVNVVKFKLEKMKGQIEQLEKKSMQRAVFLCPNCGKTFSDLEAGDLLDMCSGDLKCTFCSAEVAEDESSRPKADARLMLAKFNDQMQPLLELLRRCDEEKLTEAQAREPTAEEAKKRPDPSRTSGDRWASQTSQFSHNTQVTVSEDATGPVRQKKEMPSFLQQSIVTQDLPAATFNIKMEDIKEEATWVKSEPQVRQQEILRQVLQVEQRQAEQRQARVVVKSEPEPEPEPVMGNETAMTLYCGGQLVSYHGVTEAMLQQMSPEEMNQYMLVGQQVYSHLNE